ncbi:hypothetical protein EON65_09995 [archaeon]|nr:MAG: hypothetical protein EON65_09995 [archaeon]
MHVFHIGLVFSFILVTILLVRHAPEVRRRMTERMSPIKTYRDKSVYALDSHKVRHLIPDWNTFVSSGFSQAEIKTVADEEMEKYPIGEPLGQIEEVAVGPQGCPCQESAEYADQLKKKEPGFETLSICLVENVHATSLFDQLSESDVSNAGSKLPPGFQWVSSAYNQSYFNTQHDMPTDLKECYVVIEVLGGESELMEKYECPEQCLPVPFSAIPLSWLTIGQHGHKHHSPSFSLFNLAHLGNKFDPHMAITCSMTFAQLLGPAVRTVDHHLVHNSTASSLLLGHSAASAHASVQVSSVDMLQAVAKRRFEECNEKPYWQLLNKLPHNIQQPVSTSDDKAAPLHLSIERRHVHGLVIWVGSTTRYSMLQMMIKVLQNMTTTPSEHIAGWLAYEAQYGCRIGSTLCQISGSYYFPGMPSTRLNAISAGWACAQRRPLRAVAHTLYLYDPNYILLVDDDTFVARKMLASQTFNHFVHNSAMVTNAIYGELTWGKRVTKRGFYWGGAGYMFGKATIDHLNGKVISGPVDHTTGMINPQQMVELSVMYEAVARTQQHCPGKCFTNITKIDEPLLTVEEIVPKAKTLLQLQATLNDLRLVDLCVRMMSQEQTCYHSDHAISRCFIHGVYAGPWHVDCGGSDLPGGLRMGMCMGTGNCDVNMHLACHRWIPNATDPWQSAPMYH